MEIFSRCECRRSRNFQQIKSKVHWKFDLLFDSCLLYQNYFFILRRSIRFMHLYTVHCERAIEYFIFCSLLLLLLPSVHKIQTERTRCVMCMLLSRTPWFQIVISRFTDKPIQLQLIYIFHSTGFTFFQRALHHFICSIIVIMKWIA